MRVELKHFHLFAGLGGGALGFQHELAALQGLVEPGERLELDGEADSKWRERVGNAVPPPAAAAIAGEMGRAILLARLGETFVLANTPVLVREFVVATAVEIPEVLP